MFVKTLESFAKLSLKYSSIFTKYNVFSSSTNNSSHSIRAHFHLVGLLLQPDDNSSNTTGSSDTTTNSLMTDDDNDDSQMFSVDVRCSDPSLKRINRGSRIAWFGSDCFNW